MRKCGQGPTGLDRKTRGGLGVGFKSKSGTNQWVSSSEWESDLRL